MEVNFGISNNVEKQKAKLLKMIGQIDARMISRFGKGTYLPTVNIIASSKDTEQSFLDSYINTKQQNESRTTLTIDEPQWVVRNDKGSPEDIGAFWVAVGGLTLAHELLPIGATEDLVDRYRSKGYRMIKVPPIYREHFETNLDQALMDDAGISSANTTKFISGARLTQAKIDSYINPFLKDVIEVGNDPNDKMQYFNFFDLNAIPPECRGKPMFIHLDLSISGDKTGIAGTWIMGKTPTIEGQDSSLSLKYRLAFSVSVKAPKGFQVSFEKTRTFIKWLREQGFAIKGISADTFNSANLLQELKADGFRTEIISVDRVDTQSKTCVPYYYLKSALYEQRIELYQKCDLLTDELILLERLSDGHIDHPKNGSKDQADAVCGSLYLASKFAEEYAFSYGENLSAALDANDLLDDEDKKTKLLRDFQTLLADIYPENIASEQNTDYSYYTDIMDGIIVI